MLSLQENSKKLSEGKPFDFYLYGKYIAIWSKNIYIYLRSALYLKLFNPLAVKIILPLDVENSTSVRHSKVDIHKTSVVFHRCLIIIHMFTLLFVASEGRSGC